MHRLMCDTSTKAYDNDGNHALIEMLPVGGGRLLDVGCGMGANARLLAALGWEVTGITASEREVAAAGRWCRMVMLTNLEEGWPKEITGSYDVVLMSHVLEHLCHPHELLRNLHPLLNATSVIAVALPNVVTISNRVRVFFGRWDYTEYGVLDNTHLRFYTLRTAARLIEFAGYEIITRRATGYLAIGRFREFIPKPVLERIDALLTWAWPNLFGFQILITARPSFAASQSQIPYPVAEAASATGVHRTR